MTREHRFSEMIWCFSQSAAVCLGIRLAVLMSIVPVHRAAQRDRTFSTQQALRRGASCLPVRLRSKRSQGVNLIS